MRFSDGIDDIDAAAEHRDGIAAAGERALVGGGIDAARHAADDGESGVGEVAGEAFGDGEAVGRGTAGADDAEADGLQQFDASAGEEQDGRIEDLAQRLGIARIADGDGDGAATAPFSPAGWRRLRRCSRWRWIGRWRRETPAPSSSVREARKMACGVRKRSSSFPEVLEPRPGTSFSASQ